MANPTTNYGWVMPTSASLVTNLPADFNVFGQAVDTSMLGLLGGTTGQVLSKTSATNMAFTWTTPTDQTPLTTKGDLFTFTTVDARLGVGANGTVLQADSTQSTGLSWVTPTDQTPLTTKGDIFTFSTVDARLGVGTNGQVLTADSTQSTGLKFATPASGAVVQVKSAIFSTSTTNSTTTYTDTGLTLAITPTSASNKILIIVSQSTRTTNASAAFENAMKLRINRDSTAIYNDANDMWYLTTGVASEGRFFQTMVFLDSPATTSAITYKTQQRIYTGAVTCQPFSTPSTITLMEVTP